MEILFDRALEELHKMSRRTPREIRRQGVREVTVSCLSLEAHRRDELRQRREARAARDLEARGQLRDSRRRAPPRVACSRRLYRSAHATER